MYQLSNMIDIHSHIHDKAFDLDRDSVMSNLKRLGIKTITIGTDLVESKKAVAVAENYDNVWCTIGVHPHDDEGAVFDELDFEKLLECKKVIAIGECGLDYFYLERELAEGKLSDADAEKQRQKKLFIQQIEFAKKHNLPLMLHGRPSKNTYDAYVDMLEILNNYKGVVGNVHFFVGDKEIARQFLDLGFTFSFGGVTTITSDYDEVIRSIPVENIHLETDSPYVAPKQYRGQRNSPEYLPIILKRISEIKKVSEEELVKILNQNAKRVFGVSF